MPATQASLWLETAERPSFPRLETDTHVDVAVLGAGITGLTTALLLARESVDVAVLEARWIGAGATGYTTAKLSSLHGLTYGKLERRHGPELARLYARANESGIARIRELAGELGIDCDLRTKANITYSESRDELDAIEQEVAAARRAGLDASFTTDLDLPFPVAGAVRVEEQAEFHPVKYLAGLARELERVGVPIFEDTRALSVDEGDPCEIETANGPFVHAGRVVLATHVPFLDRGLYFARTHPERSYTVALAPAGREPLADMYLSADQPTRSLRNHGEFLLVGGESHKTGQADAAERYARLERYAADRFGARDVRYRWATQDAIPADGVPFIGKLHPASHRTVVATGYNKWGLALSASAAGLLTDLIAERPNDLARLFETSRLRPRASAGSLLKENANSGLRFTLDRFRGRLRSPDLAPGEGALVGHGIGQRAAYRDDAGELIELSARCTHLGCIVAWNGAERTWDCPCHGSRFAATGEVIEGPAVHPLERKRPPA